MHQNTQHHHKAYIDENRRITPISRSKSIRADTHTARDKLKERAKKSAIQHRRSGAEPPASNLLLLPKPALGASQIHEQSSQALILRPKEKMLWSSVVWDRDGSAASRQTAHERGIQQRLTAVREAMHFYDEFQQRTWLDVALPHDEFKKYSISLQKETTNPMRSTPICRESTTSTGKKGNAPTDKDGIGKCAPSSFGAFPCVRCQALNYPQLICFCRNRGDSPRLQHNLKARITKQAARQLELAA